MKSRRLFFPLSLFLLLGSSSGWALSETVTSPDTNSAINLINPAKAVTEPATASHTTPSSEQATPVSIPPVQAAPAKPAIAPAAPAKPAMAPAAPAKPAMAPATPAKPAMAPAAPAKPAMAPVAPAKPASSIPANRPPQAQPLPLQSAPHSSLQQAPAEGHSQLIDIEIFTRDECQNCEQAKEFLAKLSKLQPQLLIAARDVRKEPAALELLKRMTQNQGDIPLNYPAFVVGGQLIIGFSEEENTAQRILDTLATSYPASLESSNITQNCETGREPSCGLIPPAPAEKPEIMSIHLFGHTFQLLQIGIPVFTVIMGVLDGLSHGSTWILVLLISLLAPMKNRSFMLAIAGTFIAVKGLIYFIVISIWFNFFLMIEMPRILQITIAGISLIAGAVYSRKYMQFGRHLAITSHEITNPGIYTRIRKIVEARNILKSLTGTAVVSILVIAGSFAYISVFPPLYTQALTLQNLDNPTSYAYLLLYDFSYLLPDITILFMALVTLKPPHSRNNTGRLIFLFSGLALFTLGIYLLRTQY